VDQVFVPGRAFDASAPLHIWGGYLHYLHQLYPELGHIDLLRPEWLAHHFILLPPTPMSQRALDRVYNPNNNDQLPILDKTDKIKALIIRLAPAYVGADALYIYVRVEK
jgi:hypothetical protein